MFVFTKLKCLSLVFVVLLLSPLAAVYVFVSRRAKQGTVVPILCFGDSLTFGMTSGLPHPYTTKLQEYFNLCDQKRPGNHSLLHHVKLYNAGRSGEKVRYEMLARLRRILQGTTKYKWVIILGGTNDLFGMKSIWAENNKIKDELSIFNAIVRLHKAAHEMGAKTVAMTIPALQCEVNRKRRISIITEVRLKINEMIRNFVKHSSGKVLLADLDKKMPLSSDQMLCGDGVHLTASAYDKMAEIIYDSIKEFV
ncbi:uncharacterized protein LOC144644387 [Oculina patagonica]